VKRNRVLLVYFSIVQKVVFFGLGIILLPILLVVGLIRPVKIGRLPCERFGHLAKNNDLFFRRFDISTLPSATYVLFCPRKGDHRISNEFLLQMFIKVSKTRNRIHVIRSSFLYSGWKLLKAIFHKFEIWYDLTYFTVESEFSTSKPILRLTKDERSFARTTLLDFNLDPNKPLVCVFVRDSAYLNEVEQRRNVNRSYHNFRNANIKNYELAINWLIDSGFQVIRIGGLVERSVEINRQGFFDYAFSEYRTAKLDVCLIGISEFVLGTASGPTDVATVLGVPHLATDYAPFHLVPLGANDMYLPKKIYDIKTGEMIPFVKYFNSFSKTKKLTEVLSVITDGNLWNEHQVGFCDNTSDEILSAVKEMINRLKGTLDLSEEERDLHFRYFELYWSKNPLCPPKTPIGTEFLKKNSELFFV